MIYGRGKVWVICSEQYEPKFYTGTMDKKWAWSNDITKAKFFGGKPLAAGICGAIKPTCEQYGLRNEERFYTTIIELELVQQLPDDFGVN